MGKKQFSEVDLGVKTIAQRVQEHRKKMAIDLKELVEDELITEEMSLKQVITILAGTTDVSFSASQKERKSLL